MVNKEKAIESAENRIMHFIKQAFQFGRTQRDSESPTFQDWLIDNKAVSEIDKAIEMATEKSEWLKVADNRLPDVNTWVVCYNENDQCYSFCRSTSLSPFWNSARRMHERPTHFFQVPEFDKTESK